MERKKIPRYGKYFILRSKVSSFKSPSIYDTKSLVVSNQTMYSKCVIFKMYLYFAFVEYNKMYPSLVFSWRLYVFPQADIAYFATLWSAIKDRLVQDNRH